MPFRPALLTLLLICSMASARAAELETAQKLWLAGQKVEAVSTLEAALKQTPEELKLRFALGVMRMELGQREQALEIFTALTQDFPDLADPYNNLAVLRAARGELDLARDALEQALRLQPDNAQAQENYGDVLLRLAQRAYQRAVAAQPAPAEPLVLKQRKTQDLVRALASAR